MKICPQCGKAYEENSAFCGVCGIPLESAAEKTKGKTRKGKRTFIIITIAVFVLALLGAAGYYPFYRVNHLLQSGENYYTRHKYEKSIEQYIEAQKYEKITGKIMPVELDQHIYDSYFAWAEELYSNEQYEEAIGKYENTLNYSGSDAVREKIGKAYCAWGLSEFEDGDEEQSILTMMAGCEKSDYYGLRIWINRLENETDEMSRSVDDGTVVYRGHWEGNEYGLVTYGMDYYYDPKIPQGYENDGEEDYYCRYEPEKIDEKTLKLTDLDEENDYFIFTYNDYGLPVNEQYFSDGALVSDIDKEYDRYGRLLCRKGVRWEDGDQIEFKRTYNYDDLKLLSWNYESSEGSNDVYEVSEWDNAGRPVKYSDEIRFTYYHNDVLQVNKYDSDSEYQYDHSYMIGMDYPILFSEK